MKRLEKHRQPKVVFFRSVPRLVLTPLRSILFEFDDEAGRVRKLMNSVLNVNVMRNLSGTEQRRTALAGLECVEISNAVCAAAHKALQSRLPDIRGIGNRVIRQYEPIQLGRVEFSRSSFRVPGTAIRVGKSLKFHCSGVVTITGNEAWKRVGECWMPVKFSATFEPLEPLLTTIAHLDDDFNHLDDDLNE